MISTCEEYTKDGLLTAQHLFHQKYGDNLVKPTMVVIQVGDNPASNAYVRGKVKDFEYVGIPIQVQHFGTDYESQEKIIDFLDNIVANTDSIKGVIVQLPLPESFDTDLILSHIPPSKDLDGLTENSPFTPCTPLGIMNWLAYNDISLDGKKVVIFGRSNLVGKPLAKLMLNADATVTLCHSHTPQRVKEAELKTADIIVLAVGKIAFLNVPDIFSVKDDCIIIDVGINRNKDGKLCGDCVDTDMMCWIGYKTPVPKGVGLLTRYALIQNFMKAINCE